MTNVYAVIFIIGIFAFFYSSSKEFKRVDQALWTLIIMVQFINLGYVFLVNSQTTGEVAIASAFVAFEGTLYPVVCLYAALNAFKIEYSNIVKRILYLVGFAILLMIWYGTGKGGFYIRSFELVHTPFGTMVSEIPGPGMYIQSVFIISIFIIATIAIIKALFAKKKSVPKSIICAYASMLILELLGYLVDTTIQLNFYVMPFVYVLTLWITAIMYKRNLRYDVDEIVNRMSKKSDTVHGYIAFDLNKKYLGSTLKVTELLPEVNDFIVDKELSDAESSLGESLMKSIEDFEQGNIKSYYLNRNEEFIRYDISSYSQGNGEKIGYLFEISDDTANQKHLALVREQEKMFEEAKLYEQHEREQREIFKETAEALAGAIDAKDQYTHGHSVRVANYSRQIAQLLGLSESECEKVYFAGLLHDVGKIGIPDGIINKAGRLTDEEFNEIKQHPVLGSEILSRISHLPYLSIGANFHHERYDGTGYPVGLVGEEIPQMARIIAVADAYDAMTSKRSYRNTIPQQTVREELVKGMETQFDPEIAMIMIHMIDMDLEYQMKEKPEAERDIKERQMLCEPNRSNYSKAIHISENKITIHFNYDAINDQTQMPAFWFFDSLDANIHENDGCEKELLYHKYGELKADGSYSFDGVRKTKFETEELPTDDEQQKCKIEIVREKDHMYLEMLCQGKKTKATIALPDSIRFVYVALTGENCFIHDIEINRDENAIEEGTIQRIAEEITFLSGKEGNVPSIQVDGWRTAATTGILLDGEKEITFDMKSLPHARLLWHCPSFVVYHSKDGTVYGDDYMEFGLIRLYGEAWTETDLSTNNSIVTKTNEFPGWNEWKKDNKSGRSCRVLVQRKDNQIVLKTSNGGIHVENETVIKESIDNVYLALTGDQCVIENIYVK